jgi:hypothetical protein
MQPAAGHEVDHFGDDVSDGQRILASHARHGKHHIVCIVGGHIVNLPGGQQPHLKAHFEG